MNEGAAGINHQPIAQDGGSDSDETLTPQSREGTNGRVNQQGEQAPLGESSRGGASAPVILAVPPEAGEDTLRRDSWEALSSRSTSLSAGSDITLQVLPGAAHSEEQ
jgi:hypothetical protein